MADLPRGDQNFLSDKPIRLEILRGCKLAVQQKKQWEKT
jgi:hypothetical protein